MRGGNLDKLVTLQKRTRTRDPASGELVDAWTSLGDQWAEMLEGRALERYAAAQKVAEITVGFRLRWAPALLVLTPDEHRIAWNGFVYDIKGLVEIQRRQGVAALCAARTEGLTATGTEPAA